MKLLSFPMRLVSNSNFIDYLEEQGALPSEIEWVRAGGFGIQEAVAKTTNGCFLLWLMNSLVRWEREDIGLSFSSIFYILLDCIGWTLFESGFKRKAIEDLIAELKQVEIVIDKSPFLSIDLERIRDKFEKIETKDLTDLQVRLITALTSIVADLYDYRSSQFNLIPEALFDISAEEKDFSALGADLVREYLNHYMEELLVCQT